MEVNSNKIQIKGFEYPENLKDGSVRYVAYKKQDDTKQQLVELKQSYGSTYSLQVNLPSKREIDTLVIVTRTSVNCYRVIISTSKQTKLENCKTYDEINDVVKSLNK